MMRGGAVAAKEHYSEVYTDCTDGQIELSKLIFKKYFSIKYEG